MFSDNLTYKVIYNYKSYIFHRRFASFTEPIRYTEPFIRGLEERPEVVEVGRGVAHDALGAVEGKGKILTIFDRLKCH